MYLYIHTSVVDGPRFRVWWFVQLDPKEAEQWQQFGAGYLTTPIFFSDTAQLLKAPVPLAELDELDAVIDPQGGVNRLFVDVRSAHDYIAHLKKHISGLAQYWEQARGFPQGTGWFPRAPK